MKSYIYLCLILSIFASPLKLAATTVVISPEHDEYLCDYNDRKKQAAKTMLYYLNSLLWTKYAPHKWKKKHYGWNPDEQLELSLNNLGALEICSGDSFKPIFSRYVYSTQDVHTGVIYADEKIAFIPIRAEYIDNKLLVIASGFSNIKTGDEIVSMDGDSPLDHLKKAFYGTTEVMETRPHFFLGQAFVRAGSRMPTPKNGSFLTLGLQQNGKLTFYKVQWNVTTTSALSSASKNSHLAQFLQTEKKESREEEEEEKFHLKNIAQVNLPVSFIKWSPVQLEALEKLYHHETLPTTCGEADETPANAPLDWGIYKQNGVDVGYIKIESFSNIDFDQVDRALQSLEKRTQCLVIDTRGNPGGVDFSLFGLISRLTDKPLTNLMISWILDEGIIEKHRRLVPALDSLLASVKSDADFGGEEVSGMPVSIEFIRSLRSESMSCIEEWENGYTCTRFEPMRGLKTIQPHPKVRYTKPLYIMIDEKCASCADMFPAIMRDNERATLLGRTTSGAGGTVESFPITNSFGVDHLFLTTSLLLRNSMKVIEDNGVSPDLESKKTLSNVVNPNEEKAAAILYAAKNYKK